MGEGNNSKRNLGLLALGLLIVWFIWPKKQLNNQKTLASEHKQLKENQVISSQEFTAVSPAEEKRRERQFKRAEAMMVATHALGLRRFPLDPGEQVNLHIQVSALPQPCMKGDIDVIEASTKDGKSKVLMSVEPLTGRSKAYAQTLDPKGLRQGGLYNFSIPYAELEQGMGLYLCRDSSGSGRCFDKKIFSMAQLSEVFFNPLRRVAINKDPVYYFQMLIADQGQLEIPGSNSFSKSKRKHLMQYIASKGTEQKNAAKKMAMLTHEMHAKVSSVPIRIDGKTLTLVLPYQKGDCSQTLH